MIEMDSLRDTFFEECSEQLANLERALARASDAKGGPDAINEAFRAVHSIKGGAGAFGIQDVVGIAHAFETTLDSLRNGTVKAEPRIIAVLLHAADVLADTIEASRLGTAADSAVLTAVSAALQGALKPEGESEAPASGDDGFAALQISLDDIDGDAPDVSTYNITFIPHTELFQNGGEPRRMIAALEELGALLVDCDVTSVPLLDEYDPHEAYLKWSLTLFTGNGEHAVREVFDFADLYCDLDIRMTPSVQPEALAPEPDECAEDRSNVSTASEAMNQSVHPEQAEPPPSGRPDKQSVANLGKTIRVDLNKIDSLMNLVGELVINQSMLSQRFAALGVGRSPAIVDALSAMDHLTREIQERVMATRAQPVGSLFQRMSRVVREAAEATGKSVTLVTDGEGTEMDRLLVEGLVDTLTHMIRNSIDHGLEAPSARIECGKPESGTVTLAATHKAGRVVIEISDDGAGINRPRVRQVAVEKGLIAEDAQLTDSEIDNLIFLPGFSTMKEVSAISGRGVGMDVVRKSVQGLGGRISLSSVKGAGSKFTISVPLTLAVLDGMLVAIGDQVMIVPLNAIVENLSPAHCSIHAFGPARRVIKFRDGYAPLIDVGAELAIPRSEGNNRQEVFILVETESSQKCALKVDRIIDQRQIVIKSLDVNYHHVEGISGATILGDGRVALILDVEEMMNLSTRGPAEAERLSA